MRILALTIMCFGFLAGCAPTQPAIGPDGNPLPIYRTSRERGRIPYRMLDAVNALRAAAGVPEVRLNARLNAAAATHSRDMSVQNRPWHFGSDGSSPIDRVRRSGYSGSMLGENISETFETELETLAAWMDKRDTRSVILDPRATDMGFAWRQHSSGKIWWTLLMGGVSPNAASRRNP